MKCVRNNLKSLSKSGKKKVAMSEESLDRGFTVYTLILKHSKCRGFFFKVCISQIISTFKSEFWKKKPQKTLNSRSKIINCLLFPTFGEKAWKCKKMYRLMSLTNLAYRPCKRFRQQTQLKLTSNFFKLLQAMVQIRGMRHGVPLNLNRSHQDVPPVIVSRSTRRRWKWRLSINPYHGAVSSGLPSTPSCVPIGQRLPLKKHG